MNRETTLDNTKKEDENRTGHRKTAEESRF